MARYRNILETIGNTPLVKLNKLTPPAVNVYVKVEAFNPMGSIKDRMALAVIEDAERSGKLQPGQTVIEATSGNTGIGLAMVCASRGYPLVVVMAENFSVERRKLLRFLGARVVLTPASDKGTGMLAKAAELAEKHGYFLCRQFENQANADVHRRTTAVEILEDMQGDPLHYWVGGFGTGGTLNGVASRLKADSPETRIVVVEPDNSQMLGGGISQPKDDDGKVSVSHPDFRPHVLQGVAPDFISRLTEDAVGAKLVDEVLPVSGDEALRLSREMARQEGIFVGISSGAMLAGALQVARKSAPGTNIVCMLTDTGERYLSTPLFADISEEMTDAELELSRSTPNCRFDICAAPQSTPAAAIFGEPDTDTDNFIEQLIQEEPVVMFALEWCEFCWAARKLFSKLGVPFRSADLDSVDFQRENRGGRIRTVLTRRIGSPTIPQIFIGGRHLGGCAALFDAYADGKLASELGNVGVTPRRLAGFDARELLPQWVHSRELA